MRSHHIRTVGLIAGLIAVLGMASIAAGESLTDQQIGRQIERRLSEDAFSNVPRRLFTNFYEISIKTPIQPKMDVSPFQRVLTAGFVKRGLR